MSPKEWKPKDEEIPVRRDHHADFCCCRYKGGVWGARKEGRKVSKDEHQTIRKLLCVAKRTLHWDSKDLGSMLSSITHSFKMYGLTTHYVGNIERGSGVQR